MSTGVRILNRQHVPLGNPADPQGAIAGPGKYSVKVMPTHFDGMYLAEIRTPDGRYVDTHQLRSPQDVKAWVEKYVYQGQHGMYDVLSRLQWKAGKSWGHYSTSFTVKKRATNPPEESVQDKSWREWRENFVRVSADPERATETDLRRALGFLDHARRRAIRTAQEQGRMLDGNVLAGYDAEEDHYKALLRGFEERRYGRTGNPPYRRRGGSSSGYSSLPAAYSPRFVPRHLMAELSNLWHLSRVPHQGRYERMLWTSREFHKEHPELSETAIYKDLSASLEGWA